MYYKLIYTVSHIFLGKAIYRLIDAKIHCKCHTIQTLVCCICFSVQKSFGIFYFIYKLIYCTIHDFNKTLTVCAWYFFKDRPKFQESWKDGYFIFIMKIKPLNENDTFEAEGKMYNYWLQKESSFEILYSNKKKWIFLYSERDLLMLNLCNSGGGDVWLLWIYISSGYASLSGEFATIIGTVFIWNAKY